MKNGYVYEEGASKSSSQTSQDLAGFELLDSVGNCPNKGDDSDEEDHESDFQDGEYCLDFH